MPEDFTYQRRSDKLPTAKVAEAALEYIVTRREEAVSTISSKNQITLPAQLLRELGLGPGDRLAVTRDGGRLVLRARPKDWVEHYAGSLGDRRDKDRGFAPLHTSEQGEEHAEIRLFPRKKEDQGVRVEQQLARAAKVQVLCQSRPSQSAHHGGCCLALP